MTLILSTRLMGELKITYVSFIEYTAEENLQNLVEYTAGSK